MGLFNKLFNLNINWEKIKKTNNVYPPASISILFFQNPEGKTFTGWVDMGYKDYPYKKFCPYNFLIMVDLTDEIANNNPNLDAGTIEEYFFNELRKICIAHIVARIFTDNGMNIEMYVEQLEPALKHLKKIVDNPDRIVSFNLLIK